MRLDVRGMVEKGRMENAECALCGTCVDTHPKLIVRYAWKRANQEPPGPA